MEIIENTTQELTPDEQQMLARFEAEADLEHLRFEDDGYNPRQ